MASENTLPHLGGSEGNEAMLTVSHGLSCRISANMYKYTIDFCRSPVDDRFTSLASENAKNDCFQISKKF